MKLAPLLVLLTSISLTAQATPPDKFRQLEEILPTPNEQRTASGAPAHGYWQQRADYDIKVKLDDEHQRISGSETVRYHNQSPDALSYLWFQLDANLFAPDSSSKLIATAPSFEKYSYESLGNALARESFKGGIDQLSVRDGAGNALAHTVVKTMMRVDLPKPLASGESVTLTIDWSYPINDAEKMGGRSGYEFFPKDGNYIYEIAQWHPRLTAYTDVNGWQHKQFLGMGEFTLEFGDYHVEITVPADHIVSATGELLNRDQVLSAAQRDRLKQAEGAKAPVLIVTPEEAKANEKSRSKETKTWIFEAKNVRDFAFASSRKFIWDAQRSDVEGNRVLAMSFYPNEGNPLWSKYSTAAIIHTLRVYSHYTFAYPYPVAQSINGAVGGMEYPMICFNGPRPEADGTYSKKTKYALITVVIHEVGHNFFPMIVNSDERQWTWMDEGLNTFLQYLAEQQWEKDFPSKRGEPKEIVSYMSGNDQVPIMTNSESVSQLGNNAYAKPSTALNILRETVLGRDLFDFAFREYARRWQYKRPEPADFFRTMEDASGVDLDWFWRGWFYTTDHVDISIEDVRLFNIDTRDPEIEKALKKKDRDEVPRTMSQQRNESIQKNIERDPSLRDFYNDYDELNVTEKEKKQYLDLLAKLDDKEKALLKAGLNFYVVDLENKGGLVMPVIFQIDYADGTSEELRIPAELWRLNSQKVSKMIMTKKEIKSISLDPHLETADTNLENNTWPRKPVKSRFQLFKEEKAKNPMQELEKKN